jgi:hypothetical protein
LAEVLSAKPAAIRWSLRGQLATGRTQALPSGRRAAGIPLCCAVRTGGGQGPDVCGVCTVHVGAFSAHVSLHPVFFSDNLG